MKVFVHLDYREENHAGITGKLHDCKSDSKTFVRKNNQSHKNLADTA